MQGLEVALDRTGSDCRPGPHRSGETLETVRAKVFKLEQGAEEPPRALGNDEAVRFGDALQPRRQVRRLAQDAALLRLAGPPAKQRARLSTLGLLDDELLHALRANAPSTAVSRDDRPAGCCARAPRGHAAAAPPSREMNWRRFTRSPRRRGRAEWAAFLDQALSRP
jgi:hypothetical protein